MLIGINSLCMINWEANNVLVQFSLLFSDEERDPFCAYNNLELGWLG
jgi:hypothetical protein